MSGHHVAAKPQSESQIPQESIQQQSAKLDCLSIALLSVLETRVIDVLPVLGFLFLTYNVVDALFKAEGDYKSNKTISFIVFFYANLIALFCCVKSLERSPPQGESPKKMRLKVVVMWVSATLLSLPFCSACLSAQPAFLYLKTTRSHAEISD